MTPRTVPKPADFAELLRFQRPRFDLTAARLARAHTIADLRTIARKVTPKAWAHVGSSPSPEPLS